MLAIHGKQALEEVSPDAITFQCGGSLAKEGMVPDNLEALMKTNEQLKKKYLDEKKEKGWRCNNRCVKSVYTLIDQDFLTRMEQKSKDQSSTTQAGKQKFLKQQTFRFADPDKVEKEAESQKKFEE